MDKTFDHTFYQKINFNDKNQVLTLEDNINYSIKWFNSMYNGKYARFKVLEHLFFINGNGYEWVDGRLADSCFRTDSEIFEDKKFRWELLNGDKIDSMIKNTKLHIAMCEIDDNRKEYEIELHNLEKYASSFNPYVTLFSSKTVIKSLPDNISSYCMIKNIPNDVKDDYLLGAVEIINFYLSKFSSLYYEQEYQEIFNLKTMIFNRFGTRINKLQK